MDECKPLIDGYAWSMASWNDFDVTAQLPSVTVPVLHLHVEVGGCNALVDLPVSMTKHPDIRPNGLQFAQRATTSEGWGGTLVL